MRGTSKQCANFCGGLAWPKRTKQAKPRSLRHFDVVGASSLILSGWAWNGSDRIFDRLGMFSQRLTAWSGHPLIEPGKQYHLFIHHVAKCPTARHGDSA